MQINVRFYYKFYYVLSNSILNNTMQKLYGINYAFAIFRIWKREREINMNRNQCNMIICKLIISYYIEFGILYG